MAIILDKTGGLYRPFSFDSEKQFEEKVVEFKEDRGQKSEDRDQRTEDRGRRRLFGQFRNILIFVFLDENAEHIH